MPRRDRVALFDSSARQRIATKRRADARAMVDQGIAFWLDYKDGQEIALKRTPGRAAIVEGKPDRSLIVGPVVVCGAADGIRGDKEIVAAWKPKARVAPIQVSAETVSDGSILYFPYEGLTTEERRKLNL